MLSFLARARATGPGRRQSTGGLSTPAGFLCRSPRSSAPVRAPATLSGGPARSGRSGGAAPAPDVSAEMAAVDVLACMPCCYPDMPVNGRYNTCCHRMRQTLVEDLDAGEFH